MPKHHTEESLKAKVEADGCIYIRTEPPIGSEEKARRRQVWYICRCNNGNRNAAESSADYSNFLAGKRCGRKECVKAKTLETNRIKFGADHHMKKQEQVAKVKATVKKNYGVDSPMQSDVIKKRAKESFLREWGAEHAMKTAAGKQRLNEAIKDKYGKEWYFQTDEFKQKSIETSQELYGTDYPNQSDEVKANIRASNLEIYGVGSAMQNPDIKAKKEAINIAAYGYKNPMQCPEIRARARATNIDRYGHANVFGSSEIRDKIKKTNRRLFGVDHPMQNAKILAKQQKSSFQYKEVDLCGKTFVLQGYEPTAVMELLEKGYKPEDILTMHEYCALPDVPRFRYELDGKEHTYWPDLYIPSERRFIEVKSTYTASIKHEQRDAKMMAVFDAGFSYDMWIVMREGGIIKTDQKWKL